MEGRKAVGGGRRQGERAYIYTVLHVVEGDGKKSRQCHESNANSPFLSLAMYEKACSVYDGEEGGRLIGAGDDLHSPRVEWTAVSGKGGGGPKKSYGDGGILFC